MRGLTAGGKTWYNVHVSAGMMKLVDMRDLGSRASRRAGSSPVTRTTSEQAAYRLLRLFQKSERAHCAAPPFQIEPASLGFDLVLGAISKENRFDPLIATCVDKNMHSKNAA